MCVLHCHLTSFVIPPCTPTPFCKTSLERHFLGPLNTSLLPSRNRECPPLKATSQTFACFHSSQDLELPLWFCWTKQSWSIRVTLSYRKTPEDSISPFFFTPPPQILFCIYGCESVHVTCAWVPTEARKECQIPWCWSYVWLWTIWCKCADPNSSHLKEQQVPSTPEPSLRLPPLPLWGFLFCLLKVPKAKSRLHFFLWHIFSSLKSTECLISVNLL